MENTPLSTSVAKKNSHGGARPGGGRHKGSVSRRLKLIRAVADNALKSGHTPLDTMLRNMRRFDNEAEGLYEDLQSMMTGKKPDLSKILELMGKMRECRLDAQRCAVECAPFVHARLSAIAVQVSDRPMQVKAEDQMSKDELSQYYNQLRLRPTSVTPLVIDNETGEQVREEVE